MGSRWTVAVGALFAAASTVLWLSASGVDSRSPVEEQPTPSASTPAGQLVSTTSAICAAGTDVCEDVFVTDMGDGTCTTNLGRPCIEARADMALRRWASGSGSGPNAGEVEVLEVIDERTVIVGYATGSGLHLVDVVADETPDRVSITLLLVDTASSGDGGEHVMRTAEIRMGREIVHLDPPIDGRAVTASMRVHSR